MRPIPGDVLRDLRESAELSLRALGERTGLSHGFLSDLERGRRDFADRSVERIAYALDLSFEEACVRFSHCPNRVILHVEGSPRLLRRLLSESAPAPEEARDE